MIGDKLLQNKDGVISETTFDEAKVGEKQLVGFYFSAHWCPPCRNFTPKLKKAFNGMVAAGVPITIIFLSSDGDDAEMKDYFKSHATISRFRSTLTRKRRSLTSSKCKAFPSSSSLTRTGRRSISTDAVRSRKKVKMRLRNGCESRFVAIFYNLFYTHLLVELRSEE